jgi:hypothetical protein
MGFLNTAIDECIMALGPPWWPLRTVEDDGDVGPVTVQ